jgi:acetyltransferase-like isoleucine patch superfamily enzyme
MNKIKKTYFQLQTIFWTFYAKRKVQSAGIGLKVNYPSRFSNKTIIGDDCHFNGINIIGSGSVLIGDHFHSGSGLLIITQNHNYEMPNALPYDDIDISKDIHIGKNCWFGSRVIVLPGAVVEDGVVVQAGAVVFGRVPMCAVVGGNPWKVIKYRDVGRYSELEEKGVYVGWKT